jgi:hypothetical protein
MAKDLIRYDLLTQEALRAVVRKVLGDVARHGLPGDHHFLIAFATGYPGVRLSQRLREQYPEEMTIVLQHQFWDLGVTEHAFEVGLSFSNVPERLLVPFEAITQFFDPTVNFGLKFEAVSEAAEGAPKPLPTPAPARDAAKKHAPKGAGTEPATVGPGSVPRVRPTKPPQPKPVEAREAARRTTEDAPANGGGATVVSLDTFRKK